MFVPVSAADGPVKVFGSSIHLSATPPQTQGTVPELRQHNQQVYLDWLGLKAGPFDHRSVSLT